jgi:hypothetical protein
MTHAERDQREEERAYALGVSYGTENRYADVAARNRQSSEEMYQDALALGCWPWLFDVFKYGAQDEWRRRGELPVFTKNGHGGYRR